MQSYEYRTTYTVMNVGVRAELLNLPDSINNWRLRESKIVEVTRSHSVNGTSAVLPATSYGATTTVAENRYETPTYAIVAVWELFNEMDPL